MRPIDADKLIRKYIDTDIEKFSNSDVIIVLENLKQNILKAPSIDIVRCGECKYTDGEPPIADGRSWCVLHGSFMYYCSDGERSSE